MFSTLFQHTDEIEFMSGFTHFIGLLLAIIGGVVLIGVAKSYGTLWHILSHTLFSISLLALYLASTAYHLVPSSLRKVKDFFLRMDYAMIYILIAGTYTPVLLLTLSSPIRWILCVAIWMAALSGVALRLKYHLSTTVSLLTYLGLGWMGAYVVTADISSPALFWLLIGGALYTMGALWYAMDNASKGHAPLRIFGPHEIFHLFVIGGSGAHFWAIMWYL